MKALLTLSAFANTSACRGRVWNFAVQRDGVLLYSADLELSSAIMMADGSIQIVFTCCIEFTDR